jgi:hypothetical protein
MNGLEILLVGGAIVLAIWSVVRPAAVLLPIAVVLLGVWEFVEHSGGAIHWGN